MICLSGATKPPEVRQDKQYLDHPAKEMKLDISEAKKVTSDALQSLGYGTAEAETITEHFSGQRNARLWAVLSTTDLLIHLETVDLDRLLVR